MEEANAVPRHYYQAPKPINAFSVLPHMSKTGFVKCPDYTQPPNIHQSDLHTIRQIRGEVSDDEPTPEVAADVARMIQEMHQLRTELQKACTGSRWGGYIAARRQV